MSAQKSTPWVASSHWLASTSAGDARLDVRVGEALDVSISDVLVPDLQRFAAWGRAKREKKPKVEKTVKVKVSKKPKVEKTVKVKVSKKPKVKKTVKVKVSKEIKDKKAAEEKK